MMIGDNFLLRLICSLAIIAASSLSFQAQSKISNKVKNNKAKTISDWRNAFPVLPNYRRIFEKAVFEDEKLYFQTAEYQKIGNKQDFFEITLFRHPDASPESNYYTQSDWIKHLNIGKYKAFQIFPTCGLDFYKYRLEVYPDNSTSISLKAKDDSTTDVIELAKTINFGKIVETMKQRRNIY